jgi:hypothetical protein
MTQIQSTTPKGYVLGGVHFWSCTAALIGKLPDALAYQVMRRVLVTVALLLYFGGSPSHGRVHEDRVRRRLSAVY